MSTVELLLAALVPLALVLAAVALRWGRGAAPDLGDLKARVEGMDTTQRGLVDSLASLQLKLVEQTGQVREALAGDIRSAREAVGNLKTSLDERAKQDISTSQTVRRIEAVIAGARSRGAAGENILGEVLGQFPPGVIETDFKVAGYAVEYVLVLPNGRKLPIDSKWPASELLSQLESEGDIARREKLVKDIESSVEKKASEVAKYIDAATTVPWAIAALPDAVFSLCRRAHLNAYTQHKVVLMPYSLALIYLLAVYQLYLHQGAGVDVERLENYLAEVERGLRTIQDNLDNKIQRAATMLSNAYREDMASLGRIQGATASLRLPLEPEGAEARKEGSAKGRQLQGR